MELNGTPAIVTGGASGLGEATARLLTERGARVVIADIEQAVLALESVRRALDGKVPKKVIVVPQRIVNVVA